MGFTFTEMMITVVLVAVLSSAALPSYLKAVRRGRGQATRDVLLTIFAGEKTFQAINQRYLPVPVAAPLATWQAIFLENPNLNNTAVTFNVTVGPDQPGTANDTFQVDATYQGIAGPFMRIDQTGVMTCVQTTGIFANTPATGCMQ